MIHFKTVEVLAELKTQVKFTVPGFHFIAPFQLCQLTQGCLVPSLRSDLETLRDE